jgi:adenylate cyclase class IV
MATNIEWKARTYDAKHQGFLAEQLAGTGPKLLDQVDTFFCVPNGRLKLRQFGPGQGELIYYVRRDRAGPKQSDYWISRTAEPDLLRTVLGQALGVRGEVRKRRALYRVDQSRIHVDDVDGLGTFLEVEVVLTSRQDSADGKRIAEDLQKKLKVRNEDLIEEAYLDLLLQQSQERDRAQFTSGRKTKA